MHTNANTCGCKHMHTRMMVSWNVICQYIYFEAFWHGIRTKNSYRCETHSFDCVCHVDFFTVQKVNDFDAYCVGEQAV